MSFVGLRVPHETARLLSELEVPGQRQTTDSFHITMLYMGDGVPIETIAQAMIAAFAVTSRTRPFTVRTSLLTCFPKNEDGVPIICRVESEPLHMLQARLKASFKAHAVPFSDKYPEYKPHVTLAYGDETIENQAFPMVEWGAHELVLWGGDSQDDRLMVTFPLTLLPDPDQMIAQKVAQRFSSGSSLGEASAGGLS